MSLYIEAAAILASTKGSLKSRIYHRSPNEAPLKSPPARLYALIVETLKHLDILNEVIEKSGILALERKVCFVNPFRPPPALKVKKKNQNSSG